MSVDSLLPVLDAVSKFAETLPFPYVALGGVILGAIVVVLRKWKAIKSPPVVVASTPALEMTPSAKPQADLKVVQTMEDITKKTLEP